MHDWTWDHDTGIHIQYFRVQTLYCQSDNVNVMEGGTANSDISMIRWNTFPQSNFNWEETLYGGP